MNRAETNRFLIGCGLPSVGWLVSLSVAAAIVWATDLQSDPALIFLALMTIVIPLGALGVVALRSRYRHFRRGLLAGAVVAIVVFVLTALLVFIAIARAVSR